MTGDGNLIVGVVTKRIDAQEKVSRTILIAFKDGVCRGRRGGRQGEWRW